MKTKEQILISKVAYDFPYGRFGDNPAIPWETVLEAMEEYANQFKE